MNFKQHLSGGIIAATITTPITIYTPTVLNTPNYYIIPILTIAFSLFPDLDTKSTPQKWYFRLLFLIITILHFHYQKTDLALIITTASITPLMFKHRGFTHWRINTVLIPCIIFIGYHTLILKQPFEQQSFLITYGWYIIASSIGYATHLVLDTKK